MSYFPALFFFLFFLLHFLFLTCLSSHHIQESFLFLLGHTISCFGHKGVCVYVCVFVTSLNTVSFSKNLTYQNFYHLFVSLDILGK